MPLSEIPPPLGVGPDTTAGAELPYVPIIPPGPMSRSWHARLQRVECPIAFEAADEPPDLPIVYASTLGSNVVDVDGNRYVDLAAGFGSLLLGHRAKRVSASLEMQASRTWTSLGDVYPSDAKIALLERLAAHHPTPGAKVLLCQSGSDAVTAALKTAVLHTHRSGVLAFHGAYHGLGYGPLSACGYRESFRSPFAPQLNQNVVFAPYPHDESQLAGALTAVRSALKSGTIGAVLVEPILGRGGCVVPPDSFLPELAAMAASAGSLLIADEVWTGLGRCGAILASSRVDVVPDIVCLGKGLGGGLPISACIGPDPIMKAWSRTPGVVHTSTFQGHALACATGVMTLDTVRANKLDRRSREVGDAFASSLREALADIPAVTSVVGTGLMIGIAFANGGLARTARLDLLRNGYIVLTGGMQDEVITLTPPLNINEDLLEGFTKTAALLFGHLPAA